MSHCLSSGSSQVVDPISGESFYSETPAGGNARARGTSNILLHDVMYNRQAAKAMPGACACVCVRACDCALRRHLSGTGTFDLMKLMHVACRMSHHLKIDPSNHPSPPSRTRASVNVPTAHVAHPAVKSTRPW